MKENKSLFISVIVLSVIGVMMIYSSSYIWAEYKFGNEFKYLISQSIFLILGTFLMYIFSKIDYRIYEKKANLILFLIFILLLLVIIPGIGIVRNGSRSWFGIGPFGIQPSELSKIALVIFVSKYLTKNNKDRKNTNKFVLPILAIILIFFLLIMLEPDFGTGMVIVTSLVVLIFITGTKTTIFIKMGALGMLGIASLIIAAPYRLKRIVSFINPWSDPLGSGFQIIQSLYAIGPGGILGQGFLNSRQKHFYLPEPQTDFIFSIISEEFGILGIIIISSFFLFIFYKCIKISLNTTNLFGKYLSFGLIFMLIFQTILNLSVVIGLIPVTGVTLPFLSYGGSSLLISMISIGIILNVARQNN